MARSLHPVMLAVDAELRAGGVGGLALGRVIRYCFDRLPDPPYHGLQPEDGLCGGRTSTLDAQVIFEARNCLGVTPTIRLK
jgi:hypothetical protein